MEGHQRDGADGGSPEEVGAVIGTLRKYGLTGHKLALQVGDEEALAKQVATEVGMDHEPWITGVVAGLVKDACEALEMSVRLSGSKALPGIQAVNDAMESMSRSSRQEDPGKVYKEALVKVVIPVKGQMQKLKKGLAAPKMSEEEEEEEEMVLHALIEELEKMGAPVLEKIKGARNPQRTRMALLGKYRASTVKRYLAYWQGFRRWTAMNTGDGSFSSMGLVDYLLAREEEGMGASIPLSVYKAVSWMGKVACYPKDEWIDQDPLADVVVKDLVRKLESGAPPRKRAPRMLSAFIPALEELVVNQKIEPAIRAGAWVKLLKVWASLRFDDVAHLTSDMVRSYDGRFSGLMKRTKTTGAGKRVKELPLHVAKGAWVQHEDWMKEGLVALGMATGGTHGLLIPAGVGMRDVQHERVMAYAEAVAWSSEVMSAMRCPDGSKMIPADWERFWTEHSERATMASCLAAVGVPKTERDLLGRWKPEGSDQYVRSYNTVIARLQEKLAEPIRNGDGYQAFDEGAVLEDLKIWLQEKRGYGREAADDEVETWKEAVGGGFSFEKMVKRGGVLQYRAAPSDEQEEPEGIFRKSSDHSEKAMTAKGEDSDSSSSDSTSSSDEEQPKKKAKVDKLDEERPPGFIVVYNRIDRGKLHRAGRRGCWMARRRNFRRAKIYQDRPEPSDYTSRCKVCWPRDDADESSSDSEDEMEDAERALGSPSGSMFHERAASVSEELWSNP